MADACPPALAPLVVTTQLLDLLARQAAGDLGARAELEALAALLERGASAV